MGSFVRAGQRIRPPAWATPAGAQTAPNFADFGRFCSRLTQFCALIPSGPACGNPVNELCGPYPRFLEFLLAACRGFGENHVRRIGPG